VDARLSLALAAALQASEASAELLRYARGESVWPDPFGNVDLVEQLADAAKMALEIELDQAGGAFPDPEESEMKGQLLAALTRFLEGWAG
jgi:hypothetical protein